MNELIVKTEEGLPTLAPQVEKMIDDTMDLVNDAEQIEKELRESILEAMKANGIFTAKVGKYTLSQVVPKDTVTFDYETFKKENANLVESFSTTTETESFDMELLKTKYPAIYNEIRKVNKVVVIDTKRLEKGVPDIYNKYTTSVKSEKPITLAIKAKK